MVDFARIGIALGELARGLEGLAVLIYALFDQHDKFVLFTLIALEEAGIPLPAPTDTLIALAGYRASIGRLQLIEALLAVNLGTMLGSTVLYVVMRHCGDAVLLRFGRYLHLDAEKIERAESWLRRHALLAVYFGRLIPGLRIVTSAASGMFAVSFPRFLVGTALSSLTWCGIWLWVGWVFGDLVLAWLEQVRQYSVYGFAAAVAAGLLWYRLRRRRADLARQAVVLADKP